MLDALPFADNNAGLAETATLIRLLCKERDRLRKALAWYEELTSSMTRYSSSKPPKLDAMEAVIVEMSLDAGSRARAAMQDEVDFLKQVLEDNE
jgi:hypothetical protein